MSVLEKTGFCTLCRSRCGTINRVENGRLVSVRPNPDHPTGKALCPKGRAAPEIAHSARRLSTPLRRTAPKEAGDPGFVAISWAEAMDEIAAKLSRIARESGPESVAFGVTSGSSSSTSDSIDWIQRFIRGFGSPNTVFSTEICNWHKDHAHAFTFGCGLPTADYRNADVILLWGHNPATVWLAQAEAIGAARARGARVAVIDPRKAGAARDADLWLRVRPGTDAVLALGLARLLIDSDAFDAAFVRQWTNGPYLVKDGDGRFLRGSDLGRGDDSYCVWDEDAAAPVSADNRPARPALRGRFSVASRDGVLACRTAFDHYADATRPYGAASVERLTGIPAAQVEELARVLGAARSVCYHGWTGIGQHTNATQTERAIATLYALTGSFDAPGGNVRMTGVPAPVLHSMELMSEAQRAKAIGLDTRPLGPAADGWINSTDFYDAVLDGKPYPLRALFAFGSNLLVSHPAPDRGQQALAALEFHVHCDLFLNPTAAYADIVLPVSSPWENEALRLGFEITPQAQELVQLRQQIIPRQGDTRSDTWIVFDLARRLGMGDLFFGGDVEAGWNHLLKPLGLDVETLRRQPEGVRVPVAQRYRKYEQMGFATETGKVELYSERLLRHGQPPVPCYVAPAETTTPQFPFRLVSANSGVFCHSQHRGITALRRKRPEPVAEVPTELARQRGIGDGDLVHLGTRLGVITVRAVLDDALADDVIACDYGWWQGAADLGLPDYPVQTATGGAYSGASFNGLIDEAQRDPVSGAPGLRSFACDIALAEARPWRGFRPLRVVERVTEAADVIALRLVMQEGAPLAPFRPGQFIGVRVNGATRSYSLVGPAVAGPQDYRIAVRRAEGGVVSGILADRVEVGDTIEVQAPSGGFRLPLRNEFPIVLIAGGVGITPFMSYLETLSGAAGEPPVVLHYGTRDGATQAFGRRLRDLAARLPNVTVVTHFSRPRPGDSFDRAGRLRASDIDQGLIEARARFYICANDSMVDALTAGLAARGVPPFEIFRERFHLPAAPVAEGQARHEVRFARSGITLLWTPEAGPLLAFAERHGLELPSGCRAGQCESCSARILAGAVSHRLECADLELDQCLTCQAVPTTDLVLDL